MIVMLKKQWKRRGRQAQKQLVRRAQLLQVRVITIMPVKICASKGMRYFAQMTMMMSSYLGKGRRHRERRLRLKKSLMRRYLKRKLVMVESMRVQRSHLSRRSRIKENEPR
jgi:hypothetical protein